MCGTYMRSEAREQQQSDFHRINEEREGMQREREQWQFEKRELCSRIADLELEVSNLITASANASVIEEEVGEGDGEGSQGWRSDEEGGDRRVIGECAALLCV